ncbi:alkaline phosphatase family protein [Paracraurococcus lichenis]|uniref:Alkaline phosphatase family protein n=1 Tax=Paracraurococcus lichenis TaxID=3064888 RepID=A0ABT9E7V2_9PROT|nr:alkaline phosphatase family protein [Paracraurococcus sp. LOR1-02]MDO9712282.1 alkaline phosphatase family protein [Paracraurococcus sp. LOR1-02]
MHRALPALALALGLLAGGARGADARNLVLFVADGLRPGIVNADTAPTMAALLENGVRFTNTHSLFPTFTTANASGLATGHLLGDTGDFSNTIHVGTAVTAAGGSVTPFLESDPVLGEVDTLFGGDYLNQETILAAARAKGFSTASIGKVGPVLIFDHTERSGQQTIVIDDQTGTANGIPLSQEVKDRLNAAGLPLATPSRGANGTSGTSTTPGTTVANTMQQGYFANAATEAVLPLFAERQKPFVMVYWSRDPDGTQHNQGDSLLTLVPGINGPTTIAAVRNADDNLAQLLAALQRLGLDGDTDVILTSDHGFSTISKQSTTSFAATQSYGGVPAGLLPRGFVGIDIAHALGLPLHDPDANNAVVAPGSFSTNGNAVIGDPANPAVVVAANGGSDLVYLPGGDRALAEKVVDILASQDYTSGLFLNNRFGRIAGTLPISAIGLRGTAATPQPDIALNFRSVSLGCDDPTTCGAEVADSALQQGQGMHGSFSRADTRNIMGAMGPDFRRGFVDPAPASNADIGRTVAHLLGLEVADTGRLLGRVLLEATPDGGVPEYRQHVIASDPDSRGLRTVLRYQTVGRTHYFDVAGYPNRTLGLSEDYRREAVEGRVHAAAADGVPPWQPR